MHSAVIVCPNTRDIRVYLDGVEVGQASVANDMQAVLFMNHIDEGLTPDEAGALSGAIYLAREAMAGA